MMAPIIGRHFAEYIAGKERHEIFERCKLSRFEGGATLETEDFNIG